MRIITHGSLSEYVSLGVNISSSSSIMGKEKELYFPDLFEIEKQDNSLLRHLHHHPDDAICTYIQYYYEPDRYELQWWEYCLLCRKKDSLVVAFNAKERKSRMFSNVEDFLDVIARIVSICQIDSVLFEYLIEFPYINMSGFDIHLGLMDRGVKEVRFRN